MAGQLPAKAIRQFGDLRIRRRAAQDAVLAEVLGQALREIQALLERSGRPYRLRARVTRWGEYLIRMEVGYGQRAERDSIWDHAAQALEEARRGRDVHILCGIYPLLPGN
ncbi:MAG: hypothetical protein ACP5G2_02110 [Candidatus Bipolaricaulaceae bacterium]